MANEFIIRKGYKSLAASEITGSLKTTGDITISKDDPTITLFNNAGANTDPAGTIVFSESPNVQNFDINYNGLSDRLEFRGRVNNADNTDLVLINRSHTNTLQVIGDISGSTYYGDGSNLTNVTGTDSTKLPLTGGTLTGNLVIDHSTSNSQFTLRYDTTGDGTIIGDINWNNTAAEGTDDRLGIIRTRTQGGTTSTRGGEMVLYTRAANSSGFNTTTYAQNGQWTFPHHINLSDNKYLMWGGNAILYHTGTQTYIGDNSSASTLTLTGGNATFSGTVKAATTFIADAVDGSNSDPGTDNVRFSGYGMIGNRGNLYVTNFNSSGTVQIGVGGAHNAAPKVSVGTTNTTFNTSLLPGTDSTYNIGSASSRFANIYSDAISVLGQGTFDTINTGQGATEVHLMNQNVRTTDNVTFGDITATGTITAQEFKTELVSASILYESGSTKFGDTSDDVHSFSGSLRVTGSGDHYFSNGDVGIGTTNPIFRLDVESGGSSEAFGLSISGTERLKMYADGTWNYFEAKSGQSHKFTTTGGALLTIMNDGNVGIGAPTPTALLHVSGSTNSSDVRIQIENANTGTGAYSMLAFQSDENHSVQPGLFLNGANNTNYAGASSLNMYQHGNFPLGFVTSNLLRMTVTGAGNVGIGTSTPSTKFHVVGSAVDNESLGLFTNNYSSGGVFYPALKAVHTHSNHSYGTVAEFRTEASAGTDRPSILFTNAHADHYWTVGQGGYGANDNFAITYRNFHPNTGNGWGTARLIIDTSGKVGIGTTSPSNKLEVFTSAAAENVFSVNNGTQRLQLGVNNSQGSFVFEQSANALRFGTTNSERMRISSTGNVGIGTATNSDGDLTINSPTFHVYGPQTSGAYNLIARFQGGNDSDNTGASILINHSNDRGLLIKAGRKDSDREVAFFDLVSSGANVTNMLTMGKYGSDYRTGIRTTAPSSVFHVNTGTGTGNQNTVFIDRAASSDYSGISFATAGTVDWSIGHNSAGNFEIFEDGLDAKTRVTVEATSGDVGIGSTSPGNKLDVMGNVSASAYYGDGSNLTGINAFTATTASNAMLLDGIDSTSFFRSDEADSAIGFFSSTNVNSSGDAGLSINNGGRLGFDQSGTRSWTVKAASGQLQFTSGDGGGSFYFGSSIALNNKAITGVDSFAFNDPGPLEGISWSGGNWKIYESPNDLTTNTAGNLQFVSGSTRVLSIGKTGETALEVIGSGSTVFEVVGSQGQLFSVTDDLSGTLFAVSDISGTPLLEVDADSTITMGDFGTNALVVTGSRIGIGTASPAYPLHAYSGGSERFAVSGDVFVRGATDLKITGTSRRLSFDAGTGTVRTSTANNLYLQSNNSTVLELKSNLEAEFTGNIKATGGSSHSFLLGNSNNTSTADTTGFRLHQTSYTDGRWSHRFRKYDQGGGVPLYIDSSSGTANVFTNLMRIGTYTGEVHTVEVNGSFKSTFANTTGYQIAGTYIVDSSRNLVNINNTTISGVITADGITSGTTAANRTFQVSTAVSGALHVKAADGGTTGAAHTAPLITVTGNGSTVQGGIYVSQNSSTGTSLGFFTTDSYASGPKLGLSILDNGTVTINRGNLSLEGTGRIQGIDTVSAGTDAANKNYVDNTVGSYLPLTGGTLSGNINISKNNPVLILNETTSTSDADQIAYISFQDNGSEEAWIGWGSNSNTDFTITNSIGMVVLNGNGTTQINDNLDLNGNADISGDLTVNGGNISVNNNNGGILFNDASSYWVRTATNWGLYWDTSNNQLKFNGAGNTRAFIDLDTGRISGNEHGIFGSNVYAGGTEGFVFGASVSEGEYIKRVGNDIQFVAGGSTRMTVDGDNGRVGILRTDPSYPLDVNGSARIQGTLEMANNNIDSVNALNFEDPGPNEGIAWSGGNWKIYESPNDLTTNTAGNLQFVSGSTRVMSVGTSGDTTLQVIGSGSTVLDIQGSQGQLFSVTDDLTGDIFSVSDISGVPILNVNASGHSYFDGTLDISGSLQIAQSSATSSIWFNAEEKVGILFRNNQSFEIGDIAMDDSVASIDFKTMGNNILSLQDSEAFWKADIEVGTTSQNYRLKLYKADNNVSDHLQFHVGSTRIGEIGGEDTTWLRINQETAKNIYTPRYIRADGGLFVDDTNHGINGSGVLTNASLSGTYTNALTFSNSSNDYGATVHNVESTLTSGNWNNYIDGTESGWSGVSNHSGANRPSNGNATAYTYGLQLFWSRSGEGKFQIYAPEQGTAGNNVNQGIWFRTGWSSTYRAWAQFLDTTARDQLVGGKFKVTTALGVGIAASSTTGRIDASNDVVAYATSDERLKENVKPIKNALDKVSQIQGVEFDWKPLSDKEKKTIHGNEGHDVGVIAQEVESVLPEVVQERDNGYKAVRYEKLVPLLIESIKEQQQQIEDLKAIVNKLQNEK